MNSDAHVEACIKYLKARGYKVMKAITQFEEV